MRIIIAPQSLKGSLTAAEAGQAIAAGVETVYPEAEIDIVPIADGGEGTVQALVDATGGEIVQQTVTVRWVNLLQHFLACWEMDERRHLKWLPLPACHLFRPISATRASRQLTESVSSSGQR